MAKKDTSKLVKRSIMVTRDGKQHRTTVWVKVGEDKKEKEVKDIEAGEEIGTEKGMIVTKYSEKAVLVSGETYANVDLMRSIKKEVGFGTFNRKLKGWIFPSKAVDKVLGLIWSDLKSKGEDEKADAVQNKKNESLSKGDEVEVGGLKGKVTDGVSDSDGTKYNVKLDDGTKLSGVDDKAISTPPETDDKKISKAINNATAENRAKTDKKIFGLKPIENIHTYTLKEYMGLHGITDEEFSKYMASRNKKATPKKPSKPSTKKSTPKKTSTGGGSGEMTKKQLMDKLYATHYAAVKAHLDSGNELNPTSLEHYADLQPANDKIKKELSEEHKRKIAEALRKNKAEDEEKAKKKKEEEEKAKKKKDAPTLDTFIKVAQESKDVEEFMDKVRKIKNVSKEVANEFQSKYGGGSMLDAATKFFNEHGKKEEEEKEVKEVEKVNLSDEEKKTYTPKVGGDIVIPKESFRYGSEEVTLKTLDYTDVPPMDISVPSPKKILSAEKPYWMPELDPESFRRSRYTLSAAKIGEDKYLVALDGYTVGGGYTLGNSNINQGGKFAIMSLDAYSATQKYYQVKAKAQHRVDEDKKIEDRKQEMRDKGQNPDAYRWKKSRLKVLTATRMTNSQSLMIKNHVKIEGENGEMKTPNQREIWKIYGEMQGDVKQKEVDLDLHSEYMDSAYTKGAETSYGKSGTKDDLMQEFGVQVKRQNGDEINDKEIAQIKSAMESTAKVFGNNVEMNKEFGLRVSHSGDVLMHARKAVGLFHSAYNAIGVSNSYGDDQFKFTWGHEYAHMMDYVIGKKTGNTFASDKQGSTANEITRVFRNNMNKTQKSAYQNRTCECFARALEQYHAYEAMGDGRYFNEDNHVNKEVYNNKIKPLIKKFLDENKEVLKAMGITFGSVEIHNAFNDLIDY